MSHSDDEKFMRRALELAPEGWGRVEPNPRVGAVVVSAGAVVGEGYHAEWGGAHAEVEALAAAGEGAAGATLYVTLEPCAHTGKTGPCTTAIRDAGIGRVVFSVADPNQEAAGGARQLAAQGIEVEGGVSEREGRELLADYLIPLEQGRPYVALKYAMSLDARLSEAPGTATRVTSEMAIAEAHRLRAGHDAIMVGIGTVLADDPLLTVRNWRLPRSPPKRIVVDSRLRLPLDSALARGAAEAPLWVVTADDSPRRVGAALLAKGIEVLRVPRVAGSERLDLVAALALLYERGVRSVLCEGGGELGSGLLAADRVDRIYAFYAPRLFGATGVSAFQEGAPRRREWELIERKPLGNDTLLVLSAGTFGELPVEDDE